MQRFFERKRSIIMKKEITKSVFFSLGGTIINWLGGWDIWLTSLMFLMVADIFVGIIKSVLCKSDKSSSGGLSSHSMFRGGIKKILILFLVVFGTVLDNIISPDNTYIRCAVAGYYIANESLSLLENIGACGVPLPKILYKVLDSLQNDSLRHHSTNNTNDSDSKLY